MTERTGEPEERENEDPPVVLAASPGGGKADMLAAMQAFKQDYPKIVNVRLSESGKVYVMGPDEPEQESGLRQWFHAGDEEDYTDEEVQPYAFTRAPIPHREQTRRAVLWGLTIAFALIFVLQLGFAVIGGDVWERTGPVLTAAMALVGPGFGFAWGHYFSGKE